MFRLNNPIVVIDLEATAGTDEKGFQTNNFIIDLGAVLLDTDLKIVDSFSRLVKPEEAISSFITKLTGIDNAMVEKEDSFEKVGPAFENWLKQSDINPKKARLAAWGNYFDMPLLRRCYQYYHLNYPFSGTALDIKTAAFMWLSLSGRRTDRFHVESMAEIFNIKSEGNFHRAHTDAMVEAQILQKVWKELQGFFVPVQEGKPFRHFSLEEDFIS